MLLNKKLGRLGGLPEFRSGDLRDFGGPLGFDTRELGRWDSGLIAFLWDAVRAATSSGLKIDWSSLPDAIRKLLDLLPDEIAEPPKPKRSGFRPFYWLGGQVIDTATEIGLLTITSVEASNGLPLWSILVFPALFTAGMTLIDTTDSVLMVKAYG